MQRILLFLMALTLALAVGCSQNNAGTRSTDNNSKGNSPDTAANSNDNTTPGAGSAAKLSDSEKQLLQKIADVNKAEVETGQLAQSNAASPKVKDMGQKLADEHTQNQQQLQQLASQKGVQLSDQPTEESQKNKLESTKGAQFDKAFLQHEKDDHAKLLQDLKSQQDQIQDPDVKNFVQQTISAVQQHLDMLQGKGAASQPSGQ